MMKLYKNKFTKEQMNILNTIEIESQRERYMSIFAFMLEHKNKQTGKLEISLYNLEQKYNLNRKRACLQTIKNAAKKFVELDLLTLEKIDGKNIYTFKYTEEGNNNENL